MHKTKQTPSIPLTDIVSLSEKFISIPSQSGDKEHTDAMIEVAKKELKEFKPLSFVSQNLTSLLYSNQKPDIKHFKIILNAHLDVVPGKKEQYVPKIEDGKLYGRGAFDMKAAAAVMIILFRELAYKVDYPLGLQLLPDEELGGTDGTYYQITQGVRGNFVISGECGSNFQIVHEAKARLVIKLKATGKSSHSAHPWDGDNAILRLVQTLQNIFQAYPYPKKEEYKTTVNVTQIDTKNHESSETAYNRTPSYCEALLDVRYVPNDKHIIIDRLKTLLSENVTMEILHNTIPHQTDNNHPYIKQLQKIGEDILHKKITLIQQHGTSDIRHFASVNNDGIEFGPIGGGQHQDNEWVDIQSLGDYYQILKDFLLAVK